MKKVIFTIVSAAVFFGMSKAADPALTIPEASKAPVIDGVVDDQDPWGETWIDLALERTTATTHDMTAKFQILADGLNIYLVGQVQDATPNNDASVITNSYERDCQEIFFSMDTAAWDNSGAYKEGSWQIRIQRDAADDAGFIDGNSGANTWSVDRLKNSPNFKFAVQSEPNSWTWEMQLPIDTLKGTSAFDGELFRFDIAAADNTNGAAGGRTQQRYWGNNSDDQWHDTRTLQVVKLARKWTSVVSPKVAKSYRFDGVTFSTTGNFSVYDVTGKIVLKAKNTANLGMLKTGIYIVKGEDLNVKIFKK